MGIPLIFGRRDWIPNLRSKLPPNSIQLPEDAEVGSLITNGRWNEQVIRNVCSPYLVQDILSIPISGRITENKRFWKFDLKGEILG